MNKILFVLAMVVTSLSFGASAHAASLNLGWGDKGPDVQAVQLVLVSHGYVLGVDGVYGNRTVKAVTKWQHGNGLDEDGHVTLDDWKSLMLRDYSGPPVATPTPVVLGAEINGAEAALRAAGATDDEIAFALPICQRESHCTLSAHNYNARTHDDSYGPWQINYFGLSARQTTIGPPSSNTSSWLSAATNFLKLLRGAGRCAWIPPHYCA